MESLEKLFDSWKLGSLEKSEICILILFNIFVFCFSSPLVARTVTPKNESSRNILECELGVTFGSFSSGLDQKALNTFLGYIKNNKKIVKKERWAVGREGETSYCLSFSDKKMATAAYNDILKFVPKTSKRGWTEIHLNGEKKFQTSWQK